MDDLMKMNDLGGEDDDDEEDEEDMFGAGARNMMRSRDGGSNINQMVRRSAFVEPVS